MTEESLYHALEWLFVAPRFSINWLSNFRSYIASYEIPGNRLLHQSSTTTCTYEPGVNRDSIIVLFLLQFLNCSPRVGREGLGE